MERMTSAIASRYRRWRIEGLAQAQVRLRVHILLEALAEIQERRQANTVLVVKAAHRAA
jgi:hypothetical protein